ncbi:MAG: Ig-like domain-containing protein [Eubacterium sp.]|nr:Ig-like domain-containing protein [Eubacterium sp.]
MKRLRIITSIVLTIALLAGTVSSYTTASAQTIKGNGFTVTKISNPTRGSGQVDGLMPGGDRGNSYTWRMAELGDWIYIATSREVASAVVNMYGSQFAKKGVPLDTFWAMINVVTHGDVERTDNSEGADIIKYNKKTGQFKIAYSAGKSTFFRSSVTYGDNVYFGSYSADPSVPQYILRIDSNGKAKKVFSSMGAISFRANCVYGGQLYFGGADERESAVPKEGVDPCKMAILQKDIRDDRVWNRVADYRDFGDVAYDPIMSSWAGAPIWELTSYKGYIYATAPSTNGFVMFKGHPAKAGEKANEYGWYWEEVVGLNNGINNPGLSETKGGNPGTMRSLIGSTYVFDNELYVYNFDHAFAGEAQAFAGIISNICGTYVKPSDFLSYMYDTLHNPQKLWKLDDDTGKFEECPKFTKLMKGTTNEYIWRAGEYNGKMYLSTFDTNILYEYLTQLTSTDFSKMSKEEIKKRIKYIEDLIVVLVKSKIGESVDISKIKEKLEKCIDLLKALLTMKIDINNIKQFIENYKTTMAELKRVINSFIEQLSDKDLEQIIEYILSEETQDKIIHHALNLDGILFKDVDVQKLIPEEITDEKTKELIDKIEFIADMGTSYNELDEEEQIMARQMIRAILVAYLSQVMDKWKEKIDHIIDNIDWKGLEMYMYISNRVKENEAGFDLYRTEDALNFEKITTNGFGDKYNYGCSSFLATDQGLYIGTCNPFFGGQLYLLKDDMKTTVSLSKTKATVYIKNKKTIKATVTNPVGNTTYTTSNKKVATVSKKGVVTAKKKGTAKIKVTNNGVTKTFTVTVKNIKLNKKKKKLKIGKSFKLKVKKGLVGKAKYKSSNKRIAKVTKKGKVKAVGYGNATITVKANGKKLKCKVKARWR